MPTATRSGNTEQLTTVQDLETARDVALACDVAAEKFWFETAGVLFREDSDIDSGEITTSIGQRFDELKIWIAKWEAVPKHVVEVLQRATSEHRADVVRCFGSPDLTAHEAAYHLARTFASLEQRQFAIPAEASDIDAKRATCKALGQAAWKAVDFDTSRGDGRQIAHEFQAIEGRIIQEHLWAVEIVEPVAPQPGVPIFEGRTDELAKEYNVSDDTIARWATGKSPPPPGLRLERVRHGYYRVYPD